MSYVFEGFVVEYLRFYRDCYRRFMGAWTSCVVKYWNLNPACVPIPLPLPVTFHERVDLI